MLLTAAYPLGHLVVLPSCTYTYRIPTYCLYTYLPYYLLARLSTSSEADARVLAPLAHPHPLEPPVCLSVPAPCPSTTTNCTGYL